MTITVWVASGNPLLSDDLIEHLGSKWPDRVVNVTTSLDPERWKQIDFSDPDKAPAILVIDLSSVAAATTMTTEGLVSRRRRQFSGPIINLSGGAPAPGWINPHRGDRHCIHYDLHVAIDEFLAKQ